MLILLLLFDIVWVLFPESELEVLNFLKFMFSLPMPGMPAAAVLILSMILLFIEPADATPILDFFSLEE